MTARPRVHLAGVGGSGMSALAQVLAAAGYRVSGSDRARDRGDGAALWDQLAAAGVALYPQDGSGVAADAEALIVSTAVEPDNPDVLRARAAGVPLEHRAERLARMANRRRCVAVTGTSGKSTVTGMIGWLLEQTGADPTVVNGAPLLNWADDRAPGNVRCGGARGPWVVEADESDRSLLHFRPTWGVVTNAAADHFSRGETEALFRTFAAQVGEGGCINALNRPRWLREFRPEVGRLESGFRYGGVRFRVPLPGRHN
ncbi:MAG: UDP-N-acetylmuramate--alanine ligase, partial [Lentisphaerae bacterium]|nr:UDP-N-acetylmuramate--alanine ligase [Lentisphaerota bacterium]